MHLSNFYSVLIHGRVSEMYLIQNGIQKCRRSDLKNIRFMRSDRCKDSDLCHIRVKNKKSDASLEPGGVYVA